MNIRLGVYEIFSRIVPGGFYLAAILQLLVVMGVLQLDWQSVDNVSLLMSLGLVVVCYILGEAFDMFALAWFRLFKRSGYSARTFALFKQRHQDRWEINFKENDWPILLAFIRTKNLELAGEIERHNALSIMLRNASLALLLMAINSFIQFLLVRSEIYIGVALIFLVISLLIIYESIKFRGWFYGSIFETMLAYRIDIEDSIKPLKKPAKPSKGNK